MNLSTPLDIVTITTFTPQEALSFTIGGWSSLKYPKYKNIPQKGQQIHSLQILNQNTLVDHYAWLYDPQKVPTAATIAGKIYAGSEIGNLVYYDEEALAYSFYVIENKIFVSNGDIYTIVSSGLIKDGSNSIMNKYDPSKQF